MPIQLHLKQLISFVDPDEVHRELVACRQIYNRELSFFADLNSVQCFQHRLDWRYSPDRGLIVDKPHFVVAKH